MTRPEIEQHRVSKMALQHGGGPVAPLRESVAEAIGHLEQALPLAQRAGDGRGEARILGNLGVVHSSTGQCEVAVIAYASTQRSDAGKLVTGADILPYERPYGFGNLLIEQGRLRGEGSQVVKGYLCAALTVGVMCTVAVVLLQAAARWVLALRGLDRRPAAGDNG